MRVGILGSGDVGQTLGAGFATLGHEVKIGTREPGSAKLKEWTSRAGARASTGTFAEAAAFGELLVVATAHAGTLPALQLAGAANTAGKVVIDATNALDRSGAKLTLAVGFDDSAAEQIQRALPQARVVKAFNTVGANWMFRPQLPGGPPTMFYAGNDEAAKDEVRKILDDFGWDSVDLGGLENARYLEPMAMVWIIQAMRSRSRNHAFKLLQK
jgi:8-hydroxy-5-deazaflavin:NADPH oxidoreductase